MTDHLTDEQLVKVIEHRLRDSQRNDNPAGQLAILREATEYVLALVKRLIEQTTALENRLDQRASPGAPSPRIFNAR